MRKLCISGGAAKAHGVSPASYLSAESANRMQFGNTSFDNHGFAAKMAKDRSMEVFNAMPSGDHSSGKTIDIGGSIAVTNANMVLRVRDAILFRLPSLWFSTNYFLQMLLLITNLQAVFSFCWSLVVDVDVVFFRVPIQAVLQRQTCSEPLLPGMLENRLFLMLAFRLRNNS